MLDNVAIDGPAGAGKSTAARLLAQKLGFLYIDTGAMYRAITLKVIEEKINADDAEAIISMLENTDITLKSDGVSQTRIYLDKKEVTEEIRRPLVSKTVSQIAKIPAVREELVAMQRKMASGGKVVMDGRDIATRVLPDAKFKFYLTADLTERAARRSQELAAKGFDEDFDLLKKEIAERDYEDSHRKHSPLCKAADAVEIDTTYLIPEEVVAIMINHIGG